LTGANPGCDSVPDIYLASFPVLFLLIISLVTISGIMAAVRSFYLRALERQIAIILPIRLAEFDGIPAPGYFHLINGLTSIRQGFTTFKIMYFMAIFCIASVFGGVTSVSLYLVRSTLIQVAFSIFYAASAAVFFWSAAIVTFDARRIVKRIILSRPSYASQSLTDSPPGSSVGRLVTYLLMPRPADVVKWLFLPIGMILGAESTGAAKPWAIWNYVLFIVLFEFMLYPARYMWNDLRDFGRDLDHPEASARMRIPGPRSAARRRFFQVVVAMVLRVALAIALGSRLPSRLQENLIWSGLVIFAIGLVYEMLKGASILNWPRPRRTPLQQFTALSAHRAAPIALVLWVGSGYALRLTTGLSVGSVSSLSPVTILTAASTSCAFGVMFVSMTWTLEATSYAAHHDLANFVSRVSVKSHLGMLLGETARVSYPESLPIPGVDRERLLAETPRRWATWRIAFIIGCAISTIFGNILASHLAAPSLCSIIASSAVLILGLASTRQFASPRGEILAFLFSACDDTLSAAFLANGRWILLQYFPLVVLAGTYFIFLYQSYASIVQAPRNLIRLIRRVVVLAVGRITILVVGRSTADLIR
jgi:hypothetical protein